MCEMVIEKAMVIDDVECVKRELERLSGKTIHDMEIVKRFICSEKNTKFFIDKKMKSSTNQDTDNTYVWLDTGFRDRRNNALFISLLNNGYEYAGHYVGTANDLSDSIKAFFPKNRKEIAANYSRFIGKYAQKCKERDTEYIEDEKQYLLEKVNENNDCKELGMKIRQLNLILEEEPEALVEEEVAGKETTEKGTTDGLSDLEREITIELLLEMLQSREQYIQELLETLERRKLQADKEINGLVEVIREQSVVIKERTDALTRVRVFNAEEEAEQNRREIEKDEKLRDKAGHNLLSKRKKIAVVGTSNLSMEVMKGIITKEFGFEEADFVYETDYDKVVHASGRIVNSSKYQAIIFGCCPHSAIGKGKWSSLIDRCKQSEEALIVVDARNNSGNLKVTKGSFRNALNEICTEILKAA